MDTYDEVVLQEEFLYQDNLNDPSDPGNTPSLDNKHYHTKDTVSTIRLIYIVAIIVWFILIYICRFYRTDTVGYIILFVPVLILGINFVNVEHHTVEMEREMLSGNFLSFIFLISALLINWSKIGMKKRILKAIMISVVLIMGSLIDIWTKPQDLIIVKHIRTIFQTTALAIIIYALYTHYSESLSNEKHNPESRKW